MQRLKSAKPSPWISRDRAEWLFLFAALLALAGYLAHTQYQDYMDIGSQQRDQLAHQALLVEQDLVPQLSSVKRALDSVRQDLSAWKTQRDFLASQGCHAYQGYFFSRPLPIEGFEALAKQVCDLVSERGCGETHR